MPSLVAVTPDVRMDWRRSDRESEGDVPGGGPSLNVSSRLVLRECEEMAEVGVGPDTGARRALLGR